MFSSLSSRNFRLFSIGQIISLIGSWIQAVAMSWLVLDMTGSGTQLGLITAIQFAPMLLLGLYGGLLADKLPKRKVLVATTLASLVLSVVLGALIIFGAAKLWMLYVMATISGLIMVIDNPTRQAFIGEMVGRNRIRNAVTLNSMIFNITRVVGPSIAGLAINYLNIGAAFLLNAASFIAVLISLMMLRTSELHTELPVVKQKAGKGEIMIGVRYAFGSRKIRAALLMMVLIGAFTYEFSVSFPLFATKVLHGNANTYSYMMAAMGIGSILGGLWVAKFPFRSAKALVPIAALFGGATLLVAVSPTLPLVLMMLVVLGIASTFFATLGNSTLQLNSSPDMRGRVMALWGMAFTGMTPLGAPVVGWVGEHTGAPASLAVGGVAALAAAGLGYTILFGRSAYRTAAGRHSAHTRVEHS